MFLLLDTRLMEGPRKSLFSVCLSVHWSAQRFSQKWLNSFFCFLARCQIIGMSKN